MNNSQKHLALYLLSRNLGVRFESPEGPDAGSSYDSEKGIIYLDYDHGIASTVKDLSLCLAQLIKDKCNLPESIPDEIIARCLFGLAEIQDALTEIPKERAQYLIDALGFIVSNMNPY